MLEEPAARSQCSIEAPSAHVPVTPVQAPLSIDPGGQKGIVAHTPAERAVSRLTCQGMSSRTELGGQKETVVNTPAERAVSRLTCHGMPSRSIEAGATSTASADAIAPKTSSAIQDPQSGHQFSLGKFLEIFIGSGSLSSAIHKEAGDYVQVLSTPGSSFSDVDVSADLDFEMLLDEPALWKHMAPPCKSFSRARRTDHVAVVKTLRSDSRPEGYGCSVTKEANKLVERCVEICRKQIDEDVFFSLENPWNSYIWDLRCVKALLKINEVQLKRVDQCTAGSPHFKPTGILTNAPWLEAVSYTHLTLPTSAIV